MTFCSTGTPTLTKPQATLGDRINLRTSGQPEEPHTLNERQAKVFLKSSLMKQVLKSPNKSTMINDLMMNYLQKDTEKVDYYLVPQRDSANHVPQNGNSERHDVFKIEDRVQCHTCSKYSKTRREMLYLWKYAIKHYRGRQEASRATNQQSIHHVGPWNSQVSIEEYSHVST